LYGDKSGNWEYDFYQGFQIKNVTWDLGGEYICLGEFQTPTSLSDGVIINNKISRNHSFTIDVKGFKQLQFILCIIKFLYTSTSILGIELIPPDSNPIEGYTLNLVCKWKYYDGNSKSSSALWRLISPNKATTIMNAVINSPMKGIYNLIALNYLQYIIH